MSVKSKRFLFYTVWIGLMISPFAAVFSNTSPEILLSNPKILVNGFQRIIGLMSFTLIFIQIMLGAYMTQWTQILGARAYKIHITQGIFAYGFILTHALLNSVLTYLVSKSIVGVFLDILPSFETRRDLLITYGKIAFVAVSLGVAAGYFRTHPVIRKNWLKIHVLNYLTFILIALHSRGIGSDISTSPYSYLYWIFLFTVIVTIAYRFYTAFLKNNLIQSKLP